VIYSLAHRAIDSQHQKFLPLLELQLKNVYRSSSAQLRLRQRLQDLLQQDKELPSSV